MHPKTIQLIGVPMDSGKQRRGCLMGPDAYRTAGLAEALRGLGHDVVDTGNVTPGAYDDTPHPHLHALGETIAWTAALSTASQTALCGVSAHLYGRRSCVGVGHCARRGGTCCGSRAAPVRAVAGCTYGLSHAAIDGLGQLARHAYGLSDGARWI